MGKIQIRNQIFETNSSSVHSLCISESGQENSRLTVNKDGYVHVELDEYYGKDSRLYTSQMEKLKYICTWFWVYVGADAELLEDDYLWRRFNEAFATYVNEHPGKRKNPVYCEGIKIDNIMGEYAGDFFDHQSMPEGRYDYSNCVVSLWNVGGVINFIFNKYLSLETGCD